MRRLLALVLLLGCHNDSPAAKPAVVPGSKPPEPGPTMQQGLEKAMAEAQPGEERELQPGKFMTMFRMQATAPTRDGWQHAVSTKGGFAVDLPLPFNDFRIRAPAVDQVEMIADSVGTKSPGLLSWLATCLSRADHKRYAKSPLPTTDTIQPLDAPARGWLRTIPLGNGRDCLLIIEQQGSDPLPPEADIQRFLHSFEQTR